MGIDAIKEHRNRIQVYTGISRWNRTRDSVENTSDEVRGLEPRRHHRCW